MHSGIFFYGRRLLFIGAHPDDIELGCGAMIAQVSQKTEVLCVTLSDNQKNPSLSNLVPEHYRSMEILGVSLITNLAAGIQKTPLSHQEVIEAGKEAEAKISALLARIVTEL